MTTFFHDEIEVHEGNDWLGMLMATIGGLIVAVMVIAFLDALTGYQLHYWIANLF